MSEIDYPFLPNGKVFCFVNVDDTFMQEAARARKECAGDKLYPVGVVLVRDNKVIARAGNGYNLGSETRHVCPRVVLECPSGTGYELCNLHDAKGHAEQMLISVAKEQRTDPAGADVYLYGHWWCCEPCWNIMIENEIRDVYLLENARVEFDRDRVYAQTLQPSVKFAYIAGAYTNNHGLDNDKVLHESLSRVCKELDCEPIIPFRDNPENQKPREERNAHSIYQWTEDKIKQCDVLIADVSNPSLRASGELTLARIFNKPIVLVSKKDSVISNFVLDNPAIVYHIKFETTEEACRILRNVLRQL